MCQLGFSTLHSVSRVHRSQRFAPRRSVAQESNRCKRSALPAMAPKRSRKYRENPDWIQHVASRLEQTYQEYPADGLPGPDALRRVYQMEPTSLHETSSQPPWCESTVSHREASLRMQRIGDAVRRSGFNPQRHVSMICGRPVVVPL